MNYLIEHWRRKKNLEEKRKIVCNSILQKKIYEIIEKENEDISIQEFTSFYEGFTRCLELDENEFNELKKCYENKCI